MAMEEIKITDCPKGGQSVNEILEKFNADDVCMKCNNIQYENGEITCKYGLLQNEEGTTS